MLFNHIVFCNLSKMSGSRDTVLVGRAVADCYGNTWHDKFVFKLGWPHDTVLCIEIFFSFSLLKKNLTLFFICLLWEWFYFTYEPPHPYWIMSSRWSYFPNWVYSLMLDHLVCYYIRLLVFTCILHMYHIYKCPLKSPKNYFIDMLSHVSTSFNIRFIDFSWVSTQLQKQLVQIRCI